MDLKRSHLLRQLPGVNELLQYFESQASSRHLPRKLVTQVIRDSLEAQRRHLLQGAVDQLPSDLNRSELLQYIQQRLVQAQRSRLCRVINATGVIIHTNLGRSPLPAVALERLLEVGGHYSNLEYDLDAGRRGSRHDHLEGLLRDLTGAAAALIVNNNAAAVMLALNTLAQGREVIVSRGQLVEIGGSFRMPEIMAMSGARLREVGTTNKTHLRDFEAALSPETAVLLKVHMSNYRILGFTHEVPLADLVALGHQHGLPVVEDLGSGCLIDLSRYGLEKEPTVAEALKTGVDLVLFSGDKLLGGPQAGLALGDQAIVGRLKRNPLTRALRPDKLTLAALEATLRLYLDEPQAVAAIPTLWMLTRPLAEVKRQAQNLIRRLRSRLINGLQVGLCPSLTRLGGGALPQLALPSQAISLEHPDWAAHHLEARLRQANPPVIARLEQHRLLLDVRTILPEDQSLLISVLENLLPAAKNPLPLVDEGNLEV